jgi:hypothetical protein
MCLLQRITLYVLYGMSKGSTERPRAHRPTISGHSDVLSAQNVTERDGLAGTNAPAEDRCIYSPTDNCEEVQLSASERLLRRLYFFS